jgi:thymidylate synthase
MTNERQYIALAEKILLYGEHRNNRGGEPTVSLFGEHLHLNLRDGFPLLTTKQMFFRSVKDELLWFLSGDSNIHALHERGVHIWDANADANGYIGPQYGAQWRHSGAPQTDEGFDQIANIVHLLRTRPTSRRMILSAWSPHDVFHPANVAYQPPCHVLSQFYVNNDSTLTCQLYQRSGDLALGVPYNIASYALLTHLLAKACDLVAQNLLITFGDVHIYSEHINDIRKQIQRAPLPPPTLRLTETPDDKLAHVNSASIQLDGYQHHARIRYKLFVSV